jgi:hypothetical protein
MPTKLDGSPRSIACIVFSCFSVFVWYADYLMSTTLGRFLNPSAIPDWVRDSLAHDIHFPLSVLAVAYRSLAITSVICCLWCWRRESGLVVWIAMLLTGLVVIVNGLRFL